MFVLTVNSSCKGRCRGWMSHSTQALGSLPGPGLLGLFTASAAAKADVLKVLPGERSMSCCSWRPSTSADSRVCEGPTGLPHTLAFTALLTWSPRIGHSQGSRSWGHCYSQNPLLHPDSLAPSPQPRPAPSSLLSLHLPKSHPSQFSKSQCKPGSYHMFMEDPCHIILAK